MRTAGMATKKLLGGVVLSLFLAAPTIAADMRAPVKAPPRAAVVAVYNWSGFYVGAQIGYGWGKADYVTPSTGFSTNYDVKGVLGGGHVGFLWQSNSIVFGAEGDINGTGIKGNDANAGGTLDTTKLRTAGSVRGIFGVAFSQWLAYGTGGWAVGSINHCFNGANAACVTETHSGWTAGGGLKYAFSPNWVGGIEYRHTRYRDENHATPVPAFDRVVGLKTNEVTFRLSYKF